MRDLPNIPRPDPRRRLLRDIQKTRVLALAPLTRLALPSPKPKPLKVERARAPAVAPPRPGPATGALPCPGAGAGAGGDAGDKGRGVGGVGGVEQGRGRRGGVVLEDERRERVRARRRGGSIRVALRGQVVVVRRVPH
jgi:hypothetical protein